MKKVWMLIAICITCSALCAGNVWAATFCVNNATDLQTALTTAQNNNEDDTIRVVQGTYSGPFTYYQTDKTYSLTLEGGYASGCSSRVLDPANTVLDGGGTVQVLSLQNYNINGVATGAILVSGFTLQNGGGANTYYGAGLYAVSKNSSTISNMQSGDVAISHNIVKGSTGNNSGGMHVISDSSYGSSGNVTVSDNIVMDNSCGMYGGGIYAECYAYNGTPGTVTITNNIVTGNTVTDGPGGGVHASSYFTEVTGTIVMTNNTITGNSAPYGGGAYCNASGGSGGTIDIYNNIIWDNSASGDGDDIYLENIYNASGYNNDYSDLRGTWDSEDGNIHENPRLSGNYHLKSSSPCIDTGNNSAPSIPATDIDGDDRMIDGNRDGTATADMGADEYVPRGILSHFLLLFD